MSEAVVSAGNLIEISVAGQRQRFAVLTATDRDGGARCLPVTLDDPGESGVFMAVGRNDATPAVEACWIRLDRAGWQLVAGAVVIGSLAESCRARIHRALCRAEAAEYAEVALKEKPFRPGVTPVPPSGKVIGASELQHLVDASLDGWLTTGRFNEKFQQRLASFLGRKHVLTTNSGSSANLLALTALTSPLLGDRALKPGDEVITVAAGFPTTVNPILQNGMVPVFVDVQVPTYNIDVERVAQAVGPRTRAIMIAHTLGNPFDLDAIVALAEKHGLWLVEDCCDALGSTYRGRKVGTFGHVGTLSFYPAHHITMGEGGAVFTDDPDIKRAVESIRDWGRDCYCDPGKDNTCGKRFKWKLGDLPQGYDHKYTYSHLGYNLKITDMQAAVGLAQMERLEGFIVARKANFGRLRSALAAASDRLVLPEATPNSDPSWFGFPVTIRPESGINREEVIRNLTRARVGTRLLFAGNLTKQPYFKNREYRVCGTLDNTDLVMSNTFWVGVYPGLSPEMIDYVAATLHAALSGPDA